MFISINQVLALLYDPEVGFPNHQHHDILQLLPQLGVPGHPRPGHTELHDLKP